MEEGRQTHWIPLADLMTGLMMVFLLITVVSLSKVTRTTTLVVQEYVQTKEDLKQALIEEFSKDLEQWDAELLGDMTIRFNNPATLFATGSSSLSPKFQNILIDFLPRYIDILQQDKFEPYISGIRVEGHTSSFWRNIDYNIGGEEADYQKMSSAQKSYINNLSLSQQRSASVVQFALTVHNLQSQEAWMREKITANGLSSSRLIKKNGITSEALSQRVEFKVVLKSDEVVQEIYNMEQARQQQNQTK